MGPLSLANIIEILSGKGRDIILLVLCLPFCQPFQIPGLSTPFGIVIGFIGLRMAFGKQIWLPQFLLRKEISAAFLKKFASKSLLLIKKMRRWIRPRYSWICHHPLLRIVNGMALFFLGIFLALPLPFPFSNLLAAWAIFTISLGLLEDDGLLLIIGYGLTSLCFVFFIFLVVFSLKLIPNILATLESCSKFQSQGFNFLTAEAGHASAHGRCRESKRARLAVPGSEEAEEEIFTTFNCHQYI